MRKRTVWGVAIALSLLGAGLYFAAGWYDALFFPWFSSSDKIRVSFAVMNKMETLRWCAVWLLLAFGINQVLEY